MEITPPSPPPPSFSPLNFLSASFSKKKTLAASIHQLGTTVLFVRGRRRGKGRRWENCFLNPSLPFQIAVLLPVFQRMASELSSALPKKERGTKKKGRGDKTKTTTTAATAEWDFLHDTSITRKKEKTGVVCLALFGCVKSGIKRESLFQILWIDMHWL